MKESRRPLPGDLYRDHVPGLGTMIITGVTDKDVHILWPRRMALNVWPMDEFLDRIASLRRFTLLSSAP